MVRRFYIHLLPFQSDLPMFTFIRRDSHMNSFLKLYSLVVSASAKFCEQVMAKADVQRITDNPIAKFDDLELLIPRGQYGIEFFQSFIRLHGKSFDYKVPYATIPWMCQVPCVSQPWIYFVVGVNPPIRHGITRYPFVVFKVNFS